MAATSNIKIDLSGLQQLDKFFSNQKQAHLGIFQSEDARDEGGSNAQRGATHEFGDLTGKIPTPKRSWLRMPVKVKANDITKNAIIAIKNNLTNPKGTDIVAKSIGAAGLGVIQEAFDTHGFGLWDANAPKTIKKKGGKNTPLIDTAEFRQSITFSVAE